MKQALLTGFVLLFVAAPAFSQTAGEHPPHEKTAAKVVDVSFPVDANRLGIQVNGIVCSFCAYGLEKALSKLDIVDPTHFENGVLVEIESQRVTLALKPAKKIDFADIYERIKDAGYDPVRFHFRLFGDVAREGDHWIVNGSDPAQRFSLAVDPEQVGTETFKAVVRLNADAAKESTLAEPVAVEIDALL